MQRSDGYDLVIVGSGVAGLVAARRSQQLGRRVIVLEKSPLVPGFGNGRLSGGWFHAAMLDPKIRSADELYAKVMDETDGYARAEVVRAWADTVRRAHGFLQEEGATFGVLNPDEESMQNVLMPHRPAAIGQQWQERGPDLLLSRMYRSFVAAGGDHLPSHRATELLCEDGHVAGVWADAPEGRTLFRGAAVLLADGGFQANPELVAEYITPSYKLRGSPNDTGDALRMGGAIGAKTVNLQWFYGYALCRDALNDDRLWPYPAPGALIYAGALVDGSGRRFVDEAAKGEIVANAIARCTTPDNCWAIFDSVGWEAEGRLGDVPVNPTIVDVGGTVLSADSLSALAGAVGLPPGVVETVVADLNRSSAVRRSEGPTLYEMAGVPGPSVDVQADPIPSDWGDGAVLDPPRSAMPRPIATPPFYAIPVIAGITFTMGGLAVNGSAQVLDEKDRPIPGLYAAGGAMGGLQGGPRLGVAGGWSEASSFALIAAEHAAG
jgi:fumarate reductase flavoprotein subunit